MKTTTTFFAIAAIFMMASCNSTQETTEAAPATQTTQPAKAAEPASTEVNINTDGSGKLDTRGTKIELSKDKLDVSIKK
jgi:biopolymer transport protein ExbD